MTTSSAPTPIDLAFSLLREGRFADAENLLVRRLQAVEGEHGHGSPAWAAAQSDLGRVLAGAHQEGRAIECFRLAAETAPRDYESRKDQLSYRLNLGRTLQRAGRLEEAEEQLRQGVQERLAFYGREHAGYAFGLEPLAALLLELGDVAGALETIGEAITNFWQNGHLRVGSALALRAAIVQVGGVDEPLFLGWENLPDEFIEEFARVSIVQLPALDDAARLELLAAVAEALEHRLGPDHRCTTNVLAALANLSLQAGDHTRRAPALERVVASYDRQGRAEEALMTALALANAQSDAGDIEASLRTYASTFERSQHLGSPELTSQVLCNWGLALNEAGQPGPAEQRMIGAHAQARRGVDDHLIGRAGVALGLLRQHQGRLDEARTILQECLPLMDPTHPDALIGRNHLSAVVDGRRCGCSDLPSTMAEVFRDFVATRLPADLQDRLVVEMVDDVIEVEVHPQRELTEAEVRHVEEVIETARAEFRHRIARRD